MQLRSTFTLLALLVAVARPARAGDFVMGLTPENDRHWIGPEYWTNPLQDWRLANRRVECRVSGGDRNVALLTRALDGRVAELEMVVRFGALDGEVFEPEAGWVGFRVGARGESGDYRDDAVRGRGLDLGVLADGRLFVGRVEEGAARLPARIGPFTLRAIFLPTEEPAYSLELQVEDSNGKVIAKLATEGVDPDWLTGGLALVASSTPPVEVDPRAARPAGWPAADTARGGSMRVWFTDWRIASEKLVEHPERAYGPILFTQHTLSRGVLHITAQMAAVDQPPGQIGLEIRGPRDDGWRWYGSAVIDPLTYMASWRVEPWDDTRDAEYRIGCGMRGQLGEPVRYEYIGTIRKDPRASGELVVAALAGEQGPGFPHQGIVEQIARMDPDLLVFTGAQVHAGAAGFGAQREPVELAMLDYLRNWALFGWAYRELFRDRPSLCLTDDLDLYQSKLWGAGGKLAEGEGVQAQDSGGFTMDAAFVNAVQMTQSGHHPDFFIHAPIGAGIEVHYGDLLYGGVSFAVLEDQAWKSAPASLLPEARIEDGFARNPDYDPARDGDVAGAELLGEEQLAFLDKWARDWSGGAWQKVVVSSSLFAQLATRAAPLGEIAAADHDSNAWPRSGRDAALVRMRRAFAFHIAGDQRLASILRYGIDAWDDAGRALSVPPVSDPSPHRWFPTGPELGFGFGGLDFADQQLDPFGNEITVVAVANPVLPGVDYALPHCASGFAVVTLTRDARTIAIECWPREADTELAEATPCLGPVVVSQLDNYGRARSGYLPRLEVAGIEDPVVRVMNAASGELVYTLRIRGTSFDPFVFEPGTYVLEVEDGEGNGLRRFEALEPSAAPASSVLTVEF